MSVCSAVDYEPSLYVHSIDSDSMPDGLTEEVSVSAHVAPANETSRISATILVGVNYIAFVTLAEHSLGNSDSTAIRQTFEVGWLS